MERNKLHEKLLKEKGITADKIAKRELTDTQYRLLIDLIESISCKMEPETHHDGYANITVITYIIPFDNRYFSITKKDVENFSDGSLEVTLLAICEAKKKTYSKTITVTEFEKCADIKVGG
jgi:hypothetical protein